MTEYDVIIVGGAMTGSCLALALDALEQPLKIAIIEASHPDQPSSGFDARAIALAQGSIDHLKQLGVWPLIEPYTESISRIEVSDRGHAGATEMSAEQFGIPQLGAVIELESVGQSLMHAIRNSAITLYQPETVSDIVQGIDQVTVQLTSGETLSGKLLVAADGTFSNTCESVGLTRDVTPFAQRAIISNIVTAAPHQQCAFERFTEHGPVALLPMRPQQAGQSQMSLVLCVNESDADHVTGMDDDVFTDYLQTVFGWRLGRISKVGQRSSYPLSLHRRPISTHHRVVAIGNAAQTLHPIAGQGFNLGLRDVVSLVNLIASNHHDLGAAKQLLAYRHSRQPDADLTCLLTETLVRTYSTNNVLFTASRNIGLMAMDWFPMLQRPFVERTLGWIAAGTESRTKMTRAEANNK